jgi:hypothetical protein
MRNSKLLIAAAVVVALAIAGFWWLSRPEKIPTSAPAGTPAAGSCWNVPADAARGTLPWPGSAVECTAGHTVEIYHVGQVDRDLIRQDHKAKGDEKVIADNLMQAEARIACGSLASLYLGDSWHNGQVTVVADWVRPVSAGFFSCALAQTSDAAGKVFVTRTAAIAGGLTGDAATALRITCADTTARYVDCAQPHRSEFVGGYQITPPNAPFNATGLSDAVTRGCAGLVAQHVNQGAGAPRTDVTVGYVGPTTAPDWLGSDQTFDCYAKTPVDVRGSLHNLGTRPLPK